VYEAVYLGIINMAGALVAILLLDKVGRRPMMITGTIGCVLTLIGMGWFFRTGSAFEHANASIALGPIMAYLLFFEDQPGTDLLAHDFGDLPPAVPLQGHGRCHLGELDVQLPVLLLLPDDDQEYLQGGDLLALRGVRRGCGRVLRLELPETKDRSLENIEHQVRGDDGASAAGRAEAA
jgi:hypothetical protein